MRKVLIRTGMSPLETPDIDWIFDKDRIGGNSGNLIYQYSVYRALMTEGTEFTSRYFRADNCTPEFIEQVNSEYDCVILPLANAFRTSFQLKPLTAFIKQMKIPCVVVGCGLQADSLEQMRAGLPYDGDAKDFVSAVLDHSAMLGLRGEMTAEYLQRLGFVPEKHFTVTGCPSMFSRGLNLPQARVGELTKDSRISVNTRLKQVRPLHSLISKAIEEHPNYHLVFQKKEEFALIRYGVPIIANTDAAKDNNGYYPRNLRHESVKQGRAIGFINAHAWHEYMKQKDFSFGSRIHGNIAAVLNGTPAFVFTTDTRTEELCRYHNIQHMPAEQVKEGWDIRDVYEKADFTSVHRGHAERFGHFVDFLNANGLEHIYKDDLNPQDVPFDKALETVPDWGRIQYEGVSLSRRLKGGFAYKEIAKKVGQKAEKTLKKVIKR